MKGIYELEMAKESTGENVMIVDSLNLAFRYKHAKQEGFAPDFYRTVLSLAKSYSCGTIILACDWGKSSYRKELYPDYKGDREEKVANQTEEEKEEFQKFFEDFEKAIDYCRHEFTVLKYKGVEADDIAAYLTHYIFDYFENDIWLISSDKDWDLLLRDNVFRFSYVTRQEYSIDNWDERYEYPLEMALHIKAIAGGKDNVVGIPGIGDKRAHTLLKTYEDAFTLYDNLPIPGKAKYIENLNKYGPERILLNLQLIDKISYCKDAIGTDNIKDIDKNVKALL